MYQKSGWGRKLNDILARLAITWLSFFLVPYSWNKLFPLLCSSCNHGNYHFLALAQPTLPGFRKEETLLWEVVSLDFLKMFHHVMKLLCTAKPTKIYSFSVVSSFLVKLQPPTRCTWSLQHFCHRRTCTCMQRIYLQPFVGPRWTQYKRIQLDIITNLISLHSVLSWKDPGSWNHSKLTT